MEWMLDSANLNEVRESLEIFPICGVTTNPTILRAEGRIDYAKHLRELTKLQQSGTDAYVLFVIQMQDVLSLEANRRTDPAFADALLTAHAAGVGVHAVDCLVTPDSVTARNPVPVRFV